MNRELELLGKLSASITHEVRNVLAIIRESSGLLLDMLSMNESTERGSSGFHRGVSTIQEQTDRALDVLNLQSRLAHSLEGGESSHQVDDILELVRRLNDRLARQRGIRLAVRRSDRSLEIRRTLFHLLMALAGAIECCFLHGGENSIVTMESDGDHSAVVIRFTLAPSKQTQTASDAGLLSNDEVPVDEGLTTLAESAGAELRMIKEGTALVIELVFLNR